MEWVQQHSMKLNLFHNKNQWMLRARNTADTAALVSHRLLKLVA